MLQKYKDTHPTSDDVPIITHLDSNVCVLKDFDNIPDDEVMKECIEMYYSCQTDRQNDTDLDFNHFMSFAYKISGR